MNTQDTAKIDLDDLEIKIDPKRPETKKSAGKPPILRSSFRVPLGEEDKVSVTIGSTDYRVLNISENGLQVLVRKEDHFEAGQVIDSLTIHVGEDVFRLQGKAAYVNQIDFDQIALGLELIFLSREQRELFGRHQKALRKRSFQT